MCLWMGRVCSVSFLVLGLLLAYFESHRSVVRDTPIPIRVDEFERSCTFCINVAIGILIVYTHLRKMISLGKKKE